MFYLFRKSAFSPVEHNLEVGGQRLDEAAQSSRPRHGDVPARQMAAGPVHLEAALFEVVARDEGEAVL